MLILHVFDCKVCGKTVTKRRGVSSRKQPLYCSMACSFIGRKTKVEVTCPGCGKITLKHPSRISDGSHQFCNQTCYRHNRIKPNTIESAIQTW